MNFKNVVILLWLLPHSFTAVSQVSGVAEIEKGFSDPQGPARPGVYWYFMDGNMSREGMRKDVESMKAAGIGTVLFLEVNVGVPRGKIDFMSGEWKEHFRYALEECENAGIDFILGTGPGWAGSGGPWVKPEQSMQWLVSSAVEIEGTGRDQSVKLPEPPAKQPFFGTGPMTNELREIWETYYADVAVLAFPTPSDPARISDIDEKAIYYRAPYSSSPNVKQYLPTSIPEAIPRGAVVDGSQIVDLTALLAPDGTLEWCVPKGKWTIMRFAARNNGATTRPAPLPGVGFEADKFDREAMKAHFDSFTEELFRVTGFKKAKATPGGLKRLHIDSWEMGAQNWTGKFREEFIRRRGYDPQPYYPVYAGIYVGGAGTSERFLWDVRRTGQELVLENHAGYVREYAHSYGLGLSIEPYDMNPAGDMELGAVADVPMCEFWADGFGYNTSYSVIQSVSLAHIKGQNIVPAEAFTAQGEGWKLYPGNMKNQTDWALCAGINQMVFHTFQHQSLPDALRPGMTMGPYSVHWDRNQTWWNMSAAYHAYLRRSQYMLQQGRTVSDILYLCPETAPHVFEAPVSAMYRGPDTMPDRKGYGFDGCPPSFILRTSVEDGDIVFPEGARYKILVLPVFETMTVPMLEKIKSLVEEGATVVGVPPQRTPSLAGYMENDAKLKILVEEIWGGSIPPAGIESRNVGKGVVVWGEDISERPDRLYADYTVTSDLLARMGVDEDFSSSCGNIRFAHRKADDCDIYFVSNRTDATVSSKCVFRIGGDMSPQLWHPVTGEVRALPAFSVNDGGISIPLEFMPNEGYFVVFRRDTARSKAVGANFGSYTTVQTLANPWSVGFNIEWGGPGEVEFETLTDWAENADGGIKYYSGTAVYGQRFDFRSKPKQGEKYYLDLGKVAVMARVWLNGNDLGVVWTAPWQVDISEYITRGRNELRIEVVNLWINRLIGDEQLPYDGIRDGQWPEWMLKGEERTSGRYSFTTTHAYGKDSPLSESGLLGPVTIRKYEN